MTATRDSRPDPASDPRPAARRIPWLMVAPLACFLALAGLFAVSLRKGDPSKLPSVLVGRPVPAFALPPITGVAGPDGRPLAGVTHAELALGRVTIVNFWASWCTPCIAEHPYLTELAKVSGAPLYGINYKDKPDNARRFLERYGNPFTAVGADAGGRTGIDWGVTAVPETFLVDGRGTVIYKHTGPISPEAIARDLLPAIAKARK